MTTGLPDYGPQEVLPCAEDGEPFAVVRVALTLTREQLRAALATGHAEQQGQPPLDELENTDIRREVEGYFGAAAVLGSEGLTDTVNASLGARLVADLDAALDRAYTRPELPKRQRPQYRDGTVTIQTSDRGEMTVDEPTWCIGHDNELVGYFTDFTHYSARITGKVGELGTITTSFSQAPYLVRHPEHQPVLTVELDANGDVDPSGGRGFARALRIAARRIERKADELKALRRAAQ
ncbi:DUF6907 domain-containing protein [Streptomyces sp. NPDC004262]